MALRKILPESDDGLRKRSRPVSEFNDRLHTLLDDMAETMYDANGLGLAAPQVGVLRRIYIIDVGDGLTELINPEIAETRGEQDGSEGCLSSPGEFGMVIRPRYAKVKGFNRYGEPIEVSGEDLKARALLHELDHLDGILFKDRAYEMIDPEDE